MGTWTVARDSMKRHYPQKSEMGSNSKTAFNDSCLNQDKATFNPKNAVHLIIIYNLDVCSRFKYEV